MFNPKVRGVIRGNMIELESDPGLGEGQLVEVKIQPVISEERRLEILKASAGCLSHLPEEVFEDLEEIVRERKGGSRGILAE